MPSNGRSRSTISNPMFAGNLSGSEDEDEAEAAEPEGEQASTPRGRAGVDAVDASVRIRRVNGKGVKSKKGKKGKKGKAGSKVSNPMFADDERKPALSAASVQAARESKELEEALRDQKSGYYEAQDVNVNAAGSNRARAKQARRAARPAQAYHRDFLCRKQGVLSHAAVQDLSDVTFLTKDEIKNVEMTFNLLTQVLERKGEAEYAVRRIGTAANAQTRKVLALSTAQLRDNLAEFGQHIFLDRLVRVFSESGEQKLTLLELLDLYSAMSRRAHIKWKCQIAFCMFDFDEDGVLNARDLGRTITRMLRDTKQSKPSEQNAALRIQARYRGMKARTSNAAATKVEAKKKKKKEESAKPKGPIEIYTSRILDECNAIRPDVMDYRFFEAKMTAAREFKNNFCVTPSKYSVVKARLVRAYNSPFVLAGTMFDCRDVDLDRIENEHEAAQRVKTHKDLVMHTKDVLGSTKTWDKMRELKEKGESGALSPTAAGDGETPRGAAHTSTEDRLWAIAAGSSDEDWALSKKVRPVLRKVYSDQKGRMPTREEADEDLAQLVESSAEDASSFDKRGVSKAKFMDFWASIDKISKLKTERLLKLDRAWHDWSVPDHHPPKRHMEKSAAKAVMERAWMAEFVKVHGEKKTEWDWQKFEGRWNRWWAAVRKTGKDNDMVKFSAFAERWVELEDEVLDSAVVHVKWGNAQATAKQLWVNAGKLVLSRFAVLFVSLTLKASSFQTRTRAPGSRAPTR